MKDIFSPGVMLRVEGGALLFASVGFYQSHGSGWLLFALLLFLPDLSMLGYLAGARAGAVVYNVFHAYPLPAALALFGAYSGVEAALSVALIWSAHIGMDRMFGYGLKYRSGFKDTHLNRL